MLSKEMRLRTFTLFFGIFDAVVLVGSGYIFFPVTGTRRKEQGEGEGGRDGGGDGDGCRNWEGDGVEKKMREMVLEVVKQFIWAEERFEEMKERSPLARQARGVVRGVGERLGRALGEVGAPLRGAFTVSNQGEDAGRLEGRGRGGKAPVIAASRGRLARPEVTKPVLPTSRGTQDDLSPAFLTTTSLPPGTTSRASSSTTTPGPASLSAPGLSSPGLTAPSSLTHGLFSSATSDISNNNCFNDTFAFGSSSECIPIDPNLDPAPALVPDAIMSQETDINWTTISLPSLPEDINWTDISPIYATGDLVYNDLTGFVYDGFDSVLHDSYNSNALILNGDGDGLGDGLGTAMMTMDRDTNRETSIEGAESAEGHQVMGGSMGLGHDGHGCDGQDQSQSEAQAQWMFGARSVSEGTCVWGLLNRY